MPKEGQENRHMSRKHHSQMPRMTSLPDPPSDSLSHSVGEYCERAHAGAWPHCCCPQTQTVNILPGSADDMTFSKGIQRLMLEVGSTYVPTVIYMGSNHKHLQICSSD